MKKFYLILSAALISLSSISQSSISAGLRAGAVSATLKGDAVNSLNGLLDFTQGSITTNNKTGFFAGAYTSIQLNDKFSIEPGAYYAQKGYRLNGALSLKGADFLGANAKAQLTTHNIDVPLVLKANLKGFQIFAGPQASYLAKANPQTTAGVLGFNVFNRTMDASEQMNRWDFGITGGLGYSFSNGLNITGGYDHGLTKTDANKNLDTYNRAFKIGLGFSF
jgi:hypothetical protein